MKTIVVLGLALSLSAWSATGPVNQGSGYAPNDGSARPGNPGTFTTPSAGTAKAADSTVKDNEGLEKVNPSPNPISKDTTLQGKTQTGPYKTGTQKQLQEEDLDYRAIPQVDHTDVDDTENQ